MTCQIVDLAAYRAKRAESAFEMKAWYIVVLFKQDDEENQVAVGPYGDEESAQKAIQNAPEIRRMLRHKNAVCNAIAHATGEEMADLGSLIHFGLKPQQHWLG